MDRNKKRAIQGRWTIAFIDESGFSPIPLVGRTWAQRGKTPVLVHNQGDREKVSAISALTSGLKLYFRIKTKKAFNSEDVLKFVLLLLRHIRGRIVIIWDNARQHHAKIVTALTKKFRRVRIEFLPGYSPDFNPDEGVWNHAKRVELANFAPHGTEELVAGAEGSLSRLRRRPKKLAAFFRQSELPLRGMDRLLNQPYCL